MQRLETFVFSVDKLFLVEITETTEEVEVDIFPVDLKFYRKKVKLKYYFSHANMLVSKEQ